MIGILDYGMGNMASVRNALDYINISNTYVKTRSDILSVDKLIIPGVGAFGGAVKNIQSLGIADTLVECAVVKKKPILGICLGMQILFSCSEEEGYHAGLNLISGEVKSLTSLKKNIRSPNVGWAQINSESELSLLSSIPENEQIFYFVHSYYCAPSVSVAQARMCYGESICVHFEKENLFGCQYHPEKSQKSGLKVLSNFSKL